jgi:hypothetical protein
MRTIDEERKKRDWDAEYELICADGTVKTVLLNASAVKDPDTAEP